MTDRLLRYATYFAAGLFAFDAGGQFARGETFLGFYMVLCTVVVFLLIERMHRDLLKEAKK